jgi:hypothetical protein
MARGTITSIMKHQPLTKRAGNKGIDRLAAFSGFGSRIRRRFERLGHTHRQKYCVSNGFTLTQPLPSRERSYLEIPLPWREG